MIHTHHCWPLLLKSCNYIRNRDIYHPCLNVLLQNNDNHKNNFYIYRPLKSLNHQFQNLLIQFFFGALPATHASLKVVDSLSPLYLPFKSLARFILQLIILNLLNVIEELVSIFCFPFSIIFNIPFTGLYFPVKWNFIPYCKRRDTPD